MQKFFELFVSPAKDGRNNNINIVRFVAAAMVIYGHMAHLTGVPVPYFFGQEVSTVAVKIFFVLSGYLIAQSLFRDKNPFRYFVRRVFRIIPGLIFVVLISVFIIGPIISTESVSSYFSNPSTYRYLQNILLKPVYDLPGLFLNNVYPVAVNGSLWTLPIEFLMYILLPVFVVLLRKLRLLKPGLALIAIVLVITLALKLVFFPTARFILWGTNLFDCLNLAPYFFAGAFLSFPEFKKLFNAQVGFAILFLVVILTLTSYWQYEVIMFLTLPYITLSFCLTTPAIFGSVFAKNDYSYGLYLWGFVVQQIFVFLIGPNLFGILVSTLICFLLTLVCAMISWHFVEKPCSILGKKITDWSRYKERGSR